MRLRSMCFFLAVFLLVVPSALWGGPAPPPGQHMKLILTLNLNSDDARIGIKIPAELDADQRLAVRDLAHKMLFQEAYTDTVDCVTFSPHGILLAARKKGYSTTPMPSSATFRRTKPVSCAYSPYDAEIEHQRSLASDTATPDTGRQLGTAAATTTRRTSKHERRPDTATFWSSAHDTARASPKQGTASAWAIIDDKGHTVRILWLIHDAWAL